MQLAHIEWLLFMNRFTKYCILLNWVQGKPLVKRVPGCYPGLVVGQGDEAHFYSFIICRILQLLFTCDNW